MRGQGGGCRLLDAAGGSGVATLGLPAPAVSISGGDAYYLWLSLAEPAGLGNALSPGVFGSPKRKPSETSA